MSFEDPFRYFELSRKDATAADVKRAYAKRLKVTRPDDDPAEFMRLRKNFESALNSIKWRDEDRANGYDDAYEDEEEDSDAVNALADNPPPLSVEPDDQTCVKNAIEQIRTLMADRERRKEWNAWLEILDDEHLEAIDTFQALSDSLRTFICERTGIHGRMSRPDMPIDIPARILLHIDEHYGWSMQTGGNSFVNEEYIWIRLLMDRARSVANNPWHVQNREPKAKISTPRVAKKNKKFPTKTKVVIIGIGLALLIAILLAIFEFLG